MDTTTSLKTTTLAIQSLFSYVEEENLPAIRAHLEKFREVDSRSDVRKLGLDVGEGYDQLNGTGDLHVTQQGAVLIAGFFQTFKPKCIVSNTSCEFFIPIKKLFMKIQYCNKKLSFVNLSRLMQ